MAEPSATTQRSVVRHRGEGDAIWLLGGLYELKLTADDTGGALSLVEITVPEGMGPPPHTHDQDELVCVVEGTATYHLAGETVEVGPGSVVFIPRGTQENFVPTSAMRLMAIYMPGGSDRFFTEAGEPAQERAIPSAPTGAPDFARIAGIAAKHGMHLIGPPPG